MRHIAIFIFAVFLCCSCTMLSRRSTIPVDSLHQPGAEKLPQLREYFAKWQQWDVEAKKKLAENTLQIPPPLPELHYHTSAQYDETLPILLNAMTDRKLTSLEKSILEKEALLHLRNALLCRLYRTMDDVRHGRKNAVAELQKYAGALQMRCAKGESEVFNQDIRKFSETLARWNRLLEPALLLPPLNTLWLISTSEKAPEAKEKMQPMKFSAVSNEKLDFALPEGDFLWMHLLFMRPTVAEDRQICLLLPPLPDNASVTLNDIPLTLADCGNFQLLSLKDALAAADTQHLAVKVPRDFPGKAMLPPILVSIPEKP